MEELIRRKQIRLFIAENENRLADINYVYDQKLAAVEILEEDSGWESIEKLNQLYIEMEELGSEMETIESVLFYRKEELAKIK